MTLTVERETWDLRTLPRAASGLWQPGVCTEAPKVPAALPRQDPGAMDQHFANPLRVPLPIPPTHRGVHSRASQVRPPTPPTSALTPGPCGQPLTISPSPKLLARSSLSSNLGLSLDLQLQVERLQGEKPVVLGPPSLHLQHRVRGAACPGAGLQGRWGSVLGSEPLSCPQVPLLRKRWPKEPLSNLRGFFPAAIRPYKVRAPCSSQRHLPLGGNLLMSPIFPLLQILCSNLT